MSSAQVDVEFIVMASDKTELTTYRSGAMTSSAKVPCVVTGLDKEEPQKKNTGMAGIMGKK